MLTDRRTLALQLLTFTCSVYKQKKLADSGCVKTPEDFVRQALDEVATGKHGFDLRGDSVFHFVSDVIAHLMEEETAGMPAPM